MKILITGTNGYLGKFLANYFKNDHDIYTISRKQDQLSHVKKNFVGDLSDNIFVSSISLNVDVIINCAANTKHFDKFSKSYNDNCLSIKNLINNKNLDYHKLIHISTEAVFLDNKEIDVNEKSNYPKKNISNYSHTKKLSEEYVKEYSTKNKRNFIILRTRLIWDSKNSPVFKKLDEAIKKKLFFLVDKGNYYTFATHIDNLALGIHRCMSNGKNQRTYFITDGKPIKFNLLIDQILDSKGIHKNLISFPRYLIYMLCLICDFIYILSFKKIRLPLSLSLYYLTMSKVNIDDTFSKKELNFSPKTFY